MNSAEPVKDGYGNTKLPRIEPIEEEGLVHADLEHGCLRASSPHDCVSICVNVCQEPRQKRDGQG